MELPTDLSRYNLGAAHHEAGHAVAAFKHNKRIKVVRLYADSADGLTEFVDPTGEQREDAIVLRAGREAHIRFASQFQRRELYIKPGAFGDDNTRFDILVAGIAAKEHRDVEELAYCLTKVTRQLIAEAAVWRAVELIARALLSHHHLAGGDAESIIQSAVEQQPSS